jgi:quinol monooxygenase YgiN
VLLFEVYDSPEAFSAHQATAHFKKYAADTASMVKSRKRIEMNPVGLFAKSR